MSEQTKHIYSLYQLAEHIRQFVERNYSAHYWIKAELHKLNYYSRSGHCYPEFTEKRDGKIVAHMHGMIWKDAYQKINRQFTRVTGEPLREGINVLMLVSVQFHAVNGLKLVVHDIDPDYTLGDLARQRAECIERLKKEGLFDRNKTLPFPILPKRLAIISVETSKGYHDLLSILDGNEQGFRFHHTLFPAFLQGEQAVSSITAQLKVIAKQTENFDLILLIRGGGGDAGLSAYDQYELAAAVASSPLPVLTGIGHSTNQTVTEMVAARNFITPTETANFLVSQFQELDLKLDNWRASIHQKVEVCFTNYHHALLELSRRFQLATANTLHQNEQALQNIAHHLLLHTNQMVQRQHQMLYEVWPERLERVTVNWMHQLDNQLQLQEEKIMLLSPEATLKRGYSIAYYKGKAITSSQQVSVGDALEIQLYEGKLLTQIQETQHHAS